MLKMTAEQIRAMEALNDTHEALTEAYRAEDVDEWTDDAEYNMEVEIVVDFDGDYVGAIISYEHDNGATVEIDTARAIILIYNEDKKIITVDMMTETAELIALRWIAQAWREAREAMEG